MNNTPFVHAPVRGALFRVVADANDCELWYHLVLVCRRFRNEGYRPCHRKAISRLLYETRHTAYMIWPDATRCRDTQVVHRIYCNYRGAFLLARSVDFPDRVSYGCYLGGHPDADSSEDASSASEDENEAQDADVLVWDGDKQRTDIIVNVYTNTELGTFIALSAETHRLYLKPESQPF